MSEEDKSRKVRKTGSPKVKKAKADAKDENLQTEQMEVHHHPEVEKKGFKEYLLEGLMIFLAVTMGFFAESIRENITNQEHVQQLCTGMVNELATDTAQLGKIISRHNGFLKNDDSLLAVLQQPLANINKIKLQQYIGNSYSIQLFNSSDGNINAIKNELHLKQFAGSKIATYISNYQGEVVTIKKVEDIEIQVLRAHIEPFCSAHFTSANMAQSFFFNSKGITDHMRNLTQNDLEELGVNISLIKVLHEDALMHQDSAVAKAKVLINYAKQHFDLKDE